jgi:hypothetical protein
MVKRLGIKAIVEGRKVEPILGSVAFMAVLLSVLGFVVCGLSFRDFFHNIHS